MSENKFSTRIVVASNRAEPLLGSVAGAAKSIDKVWRWGEDNMLPYALSLMARNSTAHRRIINDKADYIAGKGLTFSDSSPILRHIVERANGDGDTLRSVIARLALDEAMFGNAFMEVVTDSRHSFLSFYHVDASKCRLSRESEHVVMHHDWGCFNATEARSLPLYPHFEEQEDGTLRSIVHYKDYEPMFSHYGVAPYIAGLNAAAILYKSDKWNILRIDNSFQLSGVMMLDGIAGSDADADRMVRMAEERFGGNPGQVLFVMRDHNEGDSSQFIPINTSSDGDWRSLHEQSEADLVVAHSWFRSLSGLDYSSGFSTERILHEYEVALNTVILSEQEQLLEPIRAILADVMGVDASSLAIINRPPSRSKPLYMKVWEARKADGLDYDENDPDQQLLLAQITKYNIRSLE
ncbi:MAG: phage portal protein [Rikenellaceae bacterium]|nr:phage portal protein [Rikenellaceae bacterium]